MAGLGDRRGGGTKKIIKPSQEGPRKLGGLGINGWGVPLEKVWWPTALFFFYKDVLQLTPK